MEQAERMRGEAREWSLKDGGITRVFQFNNFGDAMSFVNSVADAAREQDHHPDIFISYKTVRLTFMTHKIGGLSQNDFIMAAKIDRLLTRPSLTA
jgi:4a-hydroxytetrahydrobiopterin dehydratase